MRKWKDLFIYLVKTELKLTYEGHFLGYLWTLLDPIVMTGIYLILVVVVFKKGYPGFGVVVFFSLLLWKWVTQALTGSISSLVSKSKLLLSVKFPKALLPFTVITTGFIRFSIGTVWIFPLVYFLGLSFTWNFLWLPVITMIVYLINLGFSLYFSIIGVYFRDFSNIITFVLRAVFYLSPVLYVMEDVVKPKYHRLYMLNPFAGIFDSVMRIIRYGEGPNRWLLWSFLFGVLLFTSGWKFFRWQSVNITKDL